LTPVSLRVAPLEFDVALRRFENPELSVAKTVLEPLINPKPEPFGKNYQSFFVDMEVLWHCKHAVCISNSLEICLEYTIYAVGHHRMLNVRCDLQRTKPGLW
jgi:hypothetical protein